MYYFIRMIVTSNTNILLKVIIDDCDNNIVYEFPCGRWFADDEEDGSIFRDLLPGVGVASSYGG